MSLLSVFGVSTANAASAGAGGGSSLMSLLPMLIILFALMYFIIIRPQSKRAKQHRALISNLKKDDEVITNGGLLGKIVKITDNFMILEIATNVQIQIQKAAIATSVPKGTIKSV